MHLCVGAQHVCVCVCAFITASSMSIVYEIPLCLRFTPLLKFHPPPVTYSMTNSISCVVNTGVKFCPRGTFGSSILLFLDVCTGVALVSSQTSGTYGLAWTVCGGCRSSRPALKQEQVRRAIVKLPSYHAFAFVLLEKGAETHRLLQFFIPRCQPNGTGCMIDR